MGQITPKPYWQKKDGHFVKVQPQPIEYKAELPKNNGSGSNHKHFGMILADGRKAFGGLTNSFL